MLVNFDEHPIYRLTAINTLLNVINFLGSNGPKNSEHLYEMAYN